MKVTDQESFKFLKAFFEKEGKGKGKKDFFGMALNMLTEFCRKGEIKKVPLAFEELLELCSTDESEEITTLLGQGGMNLVGALGETKQIKDAEKLFVIVRDFLVERGCSEKDPIIARGLYNLVVIGSKSKSKKICLEYFPQLRKLAEETKDEQVFLSFAEAANAMVILYINYNSTVEAKAIFVLMKSKTGSEPSIKLKNILSKAVLFIFYAYHMDNRIKEGVSFLQAEEKLVMSCGDSDVKDKFRESLEKYRKEGS